MKTLSLDLRERIVAAYDSEQGIEPNRCETLIRSGRCMQLNHDGVRNENRMLIP
jgi:hypothetical protein